MVTKGPYSQSNGVKQSVSPVVSMGTYSHGQFRMYVLFNILFSYSVWYYSVVLTLIISKIPNYTIHTMRKSWGVDLKAIKMQCGHLQLARIIYYRVRQMNRLNCGQSRAPSVSTLIPMKIMARLMMSLFTKNKTKCLLHGHIKYSQLSILKPVRSVFFIK